MKKFSYIFIFIISIKHINAQSLEKTSRFQFVSSTNKSFLEQIIYNITPTKNTFFSDILDSLLPTPKTLPEIKPVANSNIEKESSPVENFNDSLEMKKVVQTFLGVDPDGIFGKKTEEALKSFQQENNIKPEFGFGKVDKNTLEKLDEMIDKKNNNSLVEVYKPTENSEAWGELPDKFKKTADGSIETKATFFGGVEDMKYNAVCNAANAGAVGTKVNTCDDATCVVSLPLSIQVYYFGDDTDRKKLTEMKRVAKDRDGFSKQVTILGQNKLEQIKKRAAGQPVQIVNNKTGRCAIGPIWDIGPKDNFGGGIDLSKKCAQAIFKTKENFIATYKPIKPGEKPCQGYTDIVHFPSLGVEKLQVSELKK